MGTAVAALATQAGKRPIVFRLKDSGIPRADTLRNQGWLQSGIMYPIAAFQGDEVRFQNFARSTFQSGRGMLKSIGLPIPDDNGIVGINKDDSRRIGKLNRRAELIGFSIDQFRQLEPDEARNQLEALYNPKQLYFRIPDLPFDEAKVLERLRSKAIENGAKFFQTEAPVTISKHGSVTRINFDGQTIESSVTLIAAGSGSFDLLKQLGITANGKLRLTPLLVGQTDPVLPASIFIDWGMGYSAVQHRYTDDRNPARPIVVGGGDATRLKNAKHCLYENREFREEHLHELHNCLPAPLTDRLSDVRYTAGYEVIPDQYGVSEFGPWIQEFGNVVFASPGRATVATDAAIKTWGKLTTKLNGNKKIPIPHSIPGNWTEPIKMHFQKIYTFNDAEG